MSFLDNLENSLKSLESAEEGREAALREERLRELDRAAVAATAPWAERLKQSPFTAGLLVAAARVGFSLRVKVRVAWIGSTLRLEARERRLELRPTASGVSAVYLEGEREARTEPLDLAGDPEALVRSWLA